jgi:hypothetical protein
MLGCNCASRFGSNPDIALRKKDLLAQIEVHSWAQEALIPVLPQVFAKLPIKMKAPMLGEAMVSKIGRPGAQLVLG